MRMKAEKEEDEEEKYARKYNPEKDKQPKTGRDAKKWKGVKENMWHLVIWRCGKRKRRNELLTFPTLALDWNVVNWIHQPTTNLTTLSLSLSLSYLL